MPIHRCSQQGIPFGFNATHPRNLPMGLKKSEQQRLKKIATQF
jgi:hypothetical protein